VLWAFAANGAWERHEIRTKGTRRSFYPLDTLRLVPTLEPQDSEYPEIPFLFDGFKDEEGGRWGTPVPLKREIVGRLVLLSDSFVPRVDADGTVQAWPGEADDDLFGEMPAARLVPKAALETLVAEMPEPDANEPDRSEDGVLAGYAALRDRRRVPIRSGGIGVDGDEPALLVQLGAADGHRQAALGDDGDVAHGALNGAGRRRRRSWAMIRRRTASAAAKPGGLRERTGLDDAVE
jgi:hypothetical protein